MPMLVVQQTIGDYSKWRAGFNKAGPLRDKAGIYNARVFRDADSPDKVLVLSENAGPGEGANSSNWSGVAEGDARGRRNRATKGSCYPVAAPHAWAIGASEI